MLIVTGASGYIGASLVSELEKKHIDYRGIYYNSRQFVNSDKFMKIDVTRNDLMEAIESHNPSAIMHFAAISNVLEAEKKKILLKF
ncbi:MAG: NAD-dependent epimerase/dehydratase family protein [Candidatus Coatesbacteria bacterium]|nr:NAD-dependent epimerase/dehydratase family protein [Candidatus Coatesbacteria bacterium]